MTEHLINFPLSGHMIPEIENKLCREVIYGYYRIMYKIVRKDVWITGIVHGARN
ncbi:MAG: type II toxin-antitoxin system RelE/ParE family toxin [Candidatus Omnitrophota bacterium]